MLLHNTVVLSTVLAVAFARNHDIALYEDEQFVGFVVEITVGGRGAPRFCDNLGEDWRKRVSSINTREECYEIYEELGCTGAGIYLWPGSPSHNKLTDLGFNDRMQSFRLCDLDEERFDDEGCPAGSLCRRSMNPNRPERWFWEFFFRNFNTALLNTFLNRIRNSENFIWWNFIPGIRGSKGQQYRGAVEWVMDLADADNINREILAEMRRRAADVLSDRDTRNARYGTNTASGAIHLSIANMWRTLVRVLDDAIDRNQNNDDQDL